MTDPFLIARMQALHREESSEIHAPELNALQACFNNTTLSYKYLWFSAILDIAADCAPIADRDGLRIERGELFIRMLALAWAPCVFYKLSFGYKDGITKIFEFLSGQGVLNASNPKTTEKDVREQLTQWRKTDERQFRKSVDALIGKYVPVKFLTPWFPRITENKREIYRFAEDESLNAPYAFIDNVAIFVKPQWVRFFRKHNALLSDFTRWKFAQFLQARNPSVPGVVNKLQKPLARESLAEQRKYWLQYLRARRPQRDIFGGDLSECRFDLDHFIPWSFVVHDQIWNLVPVNASLNSSKSDSIPSVDRFAKVLSAWQCDAFRLHSDLNANQFKKIREEYGAIGITEEADEDDFEDIIRRQLKPLEITALNSGFAAWRI